MAPLSVNSRRSMYSDNRLNSISSFGLIDDSNQKIQQEKERLLNLKKLAKLIDSKAPSTNASKAAADRVREREEARKRQEALEE